MNREPLRWKADPEASEEFTDALRTLGSRGPDRDQLARMAAVLGVPPSFPSTPGPAAPAAPPTAPPVPAAAGVTSLAILSGAGAAALVVSAALLLWTRPAAVPDPTPHEQAPAASLPVETQEIVQAPPPAPVIEAPAVEPARPRAHRSRPARAPQAQATELQPTEPPPQAAAPSAAEPSRLREEAALLANAEAALAGNPLEALRLANEHRRRFNNGVMSEEREVIAIDALLRLSRRSEAEDRARAFEAMHSTESGSVHSRRIRRLLQSH